MWIAAKENEVLKSRIGCLKQNCWVMVIFAGMTLPDSAAAELAGSGAPMVEAGAAQLGALRSESHGRLQLVAVNAGAEPQAVQVATRAVRQGGVEALRELVIPPRSRRTTSLPFYVPRVAASTDKLKLESRLINRFPTGDQQPATQAREDIRQFLCAIERDRPVTGLIADPDDGAVHDLVTAARLSQKRSPRLTELDAYILASDPEWLQAYDQLVLATNTVMDDPVGLIALRRWLTRGGRLWIMLDRVQMDAVTTLLGDDCAIAPIDRVNLAQLQVQDVRKTIAREDGPLIDLEKPVEMVRVLLGKTIQPAFEVNGWPAAFFLQIGRGQVLFTTLGRDAWISRSRRNEGEITAQAASPPLIAIAGIFSALQKSQDWLPPAAKEIAASQVGYSIIGRSVVAAILASCGAGVVLTTVVLNRNERRVRLAWIAPSLALAASGALIMLGAAARTAVVSTTTTVQFVEVDPPRGDMTVRGLVGTYAPQSNRFDTAGRNCVLQAHSLPPGVAGQIVWTDQNKWHLANTTFPAGITLARCSWDLDLQRRSVTTATLGARGIVGRLDLPQFENPQDAVLFAPGAPQLSVEMAINGEFRTGPDMRLERNQFIASNLLEDSARRHQEVYRELFAGSEQDRAAPFYVSRDRPTLLFWTSASELPLEFGPMQRHVGEALIAIPLNVHRPTDEAQLTIPAVLIPYETVAGLDGTPITSAFSSVDKTWVDTLVAATNITLRFQIPIDLLPLQLRQVTLYVEITAPTREILISGWEDAQRIPVASFQSPVDRRLVVSIDAPDILRLDDNGGLLLNIDIGTHPHEAVADMAQVGWHIDRVWLDARIELVQERSDLHE